MLSKDLRRNFLKYFKDKSHTIVPSSSVVPHNDPSLLFINAGMNQFKDVFLGTTKRDYNKATSSQKCIRIKGKHNDFENVGHTTRHLTFFEMLGNFSFGDYFKKEAIKYAWEVSTNVFNFDPEKIWVSVFRDDDEAFELWQKHIPTSRIVRFGEEENFWSMGDVGPCGPCSELLYDRGDKYSKAPTPVEDPSGERFLEFWNLVFMQFNKDLDGNLNILPKQSIDTGSGLERVVSLNLGVDNVFETDVLRSIIAKTENISKIKYDLKNSYTYPAFNVIADHLRTLAFAIADGIVPGNTERGYVLRKVLRRAVKYGRQLNLQKPFLADLLPSLIDSMGEDFKELIDTKEKCMEILTLEEENFIKTLKRGGNLLNEVIKNSQKQISAEDAFKLKDTYGFPLEEITVIAKDAHLDIDLDGFYKLEEKAKEISRKAQKSTAQNFDKNIFTDFAQNHKPCEFHGYENKQTDSQITAILIDNEFTDKALEGQTATIILDKTPFYAEKGGQVGDVGTISFGDNLFFVENTQTPFPNVIIHTGKVIKGTFTTNEKVKAEINARKRNLIENNHSATHLLHAALSDVLQSNVKQAGSFVDEKRLRLDFNHNKALTKDELKEIEMLVNEQIRSNIKTNIYEISFEEAQKDPSIKQIFGEKYGNKVRVVDMFFSKELCGGCHVSFLGNIGLFKIVKENSISAGVRRIEAVTSVEAENFVYEKQDLIAGFEKLLNTSEAKLQDALNSLLKERESLASKLKDFRKKEIKSIEASFLQNAKKIKDINIICGKTEFITPGELSSFASNLLDKIKSGIIAIAFIEQNKCQVIIKISDDLTKNFSANVLIKEIAPIIKGGGGGRPNQAQAGGTDPSKVDKALNKICSYVEEKC